jgi:hypothetical protein
VSLSRHLKALVDGQWPGSLWVDPGESAFETALTAFNPFAGKDEPGQLAAMRTAMNTVLAGLAAETPKIYIRTVTWRSSSAAPADDRIGFRVSTHGVYNDHDEVEYVFGRLVAHVAATGLPTLS